MQLMTDLHMFPIDLSDYAVLSEMEDIPSKKRYDAQHVSQSLSSLLLLLLLLLLLSLLSLLLL